MFIDAALTILEPYIPAYSSSEIKKELKLIQKELLGYGVTGVREAGIEFEELQLLSEMVSENELEINIYAMLNPSRKNRKFALENGAYTLKNLNVRSFKAYVDGALGSSGALLKEDYLDKKITKDYVL